MGSTWSRVASAGENNPDPAPAQSSGSRVTTPEHAIQSEWVMRNTIFCTQHRGRRLDTAPRGARDWPRVPWGRLPCGPWKEIRMRSADLVPAVVAALAGSFLLASAAPAAAENAVL